MKCSVPCQFVTKGHFESVGSFRVILDQQKIHSTILTVFICQVNETKLLYSANFRTRRRGEGAGWAGWTITDPVLGGPKLKKMEFLSVVDFLFDVCLPTMALLPTTLAGLSELGAGARGGHMSPQFVADYLNLSQPGE